MVGWQRFIAFGLAMVAVFLLVPDGSVVQRSLLVVMHGAAVVALVVGTRRHRLAPAAAWRVLVASAVFYWLALIVWVLYRVVTASRARDAASA